MAGMRRERPRLVFTKVAPTVSAGSLTPHVSVSVIGRAPRQIAACCRPRCGQCLRKELAQRLVRSSRREWRAPTLRPGIVRERRRASRLPSVPSALRGLDPHHALPLSWATIGASEESAVCYSSASSARSKSDVSATHDAATTSAGSRTPAARTAICGPSARASVKCSRRMPRASRVTSRATSACRSPLSIAASAAVSVACSNRRMSRASLSSKRRCSGSAMRWKPPTCQ